MHCIGMCVKIHFIFLLMIFTVTNVMHLQIVSHFCSLLHWIFIHTWHPFLWFPKTNTVGRFC